MIEPWMESLAAELYERIEEIIGVATQAGQVAQDQEAERAAWIEAVAEIVASHVPERPVVSGPRDSRDVP